MIPEALRTKLIQEADFRNRPDELAQERPDPLWVARRYHDEVIALMCALFGYGRAKSIVGYLTALPWFLLDETETAIRQYNFSPYRFQSPHDVMQIFITMNRLKREQISLESIYQNDLIGEENSVGGIYAMMEFLKKLNHYDSDGYHFWLGSVPKKRSLAGVSPLKRWNMFVRWMVRKDHLDMGIWTRCESSKLIMPLDTHTFRVSQRLGLLQRKSCDLKAALELTEKLREIDANDPVRFDFALYRIGQEMLWE